MSNSVKITSFLPDFCGTRLVFVVVLLAELLALALALAHFPNLTEFFIDLALYSLFIQWIALCSVAALCLSRPLLNKTDNTMAAVLSYLITILVSLIIAEAAWWVMQQAEEGLSLNFSGHGNFLLKSMSISAIVSALALRYFYVQHQWRMKIRSESEARFQALQSRIRPHFFFNCMNIITSLIPTHPRRAEEAVEDLADLFRASLQDVKNHISLKEELALCEGYLRIEKHRLGDRLNIEWNLINLELERMVPPLTLQPLVENAVYHGIELIPEGGTIKLHGSMRGNTIQISISNPIPDKGQTVRVQGHNIAQENIKQRLMAIYNDADLLKISETDTHYEILIIIPEVDEVINR